MKMYQKPERLEDPRANFGTAEAILKQKAEGKVKKRPSELIKSAIKQWCKEVERARRAYANSQPELVETCLRLADMYHKILQIYVYRDKSSRESRKAAMDYMIDKYGDEWGK